MNVYVFNNSHVHTPAVAANEVRSVHMNYMSFLCHIELRNVFLHAINDFIFLLKF